jgi:hypothetical protein
MSNPAGVGNTAATRPALSGWAVGLALVFLAFGVGFVLVWNQDTEQVAPVAPRVVVEEEDPQLKYEFEGGALVTEPRQYRSTSGNPLE